MLVLGYGLANELAKKHFERMLPFAKSTIAKLSSLTDYLLITLPMYYVDEEIAHRYARNFRQKGVIPERNQTRFLYEDYLEQCAPTLTLIGEAAKGCPNCRFIDTQSLFCEDGIHCDVFDYDCQKLLYDWGGRHPTDYGRSRYQPAYEFVVNRVYEEIGYKEDATASEEE
ncbi:unnamed protein product, partial [Mesorhabditis spiculigera]